MFSKRLSRRLAQWCNWVEDRVHWALEIGGGANADDWEVNTSTERTDAIAICLC